MIVLSLVFEKKNYFGVFGVAAENEPKARPRSKSVSLVPLPMVDESCLFSDGDCIERERGYVLEKMC